MWRGLTRKPLEDACTAQIESLGIRLLPRHELIDLVEDTSGRITGAVLYDRTGECLASIDAKATIIAAGGICNAEDAQAKLAAGASLVQLGSGLVYRGPALVREVIRALRFVP